MSNLYECPKCKAHLGENDIIALNTWRGEDFGKCLKCGIEKPAEEFKIITEGR